MRKFCPYIPIKGEHWRDVEGFPGYEISDLGRVRKSWIINAWKDHEYQHGYRFVQVWKDSKRQVRSVHSLVAEAFIGPRPAGAVVHHKDGNKKNNRLSNLTYYTRAENNKHARDTGLWQPAPKGPDHPSAVLTWEKVALIEQLYKTGDWTHRELAKKFKVGHSTIGKLLRGKTYDVPRRDHHAIEGGTE